jgi:cholesterol transport system auxiliary component
VAAVHTSPYADKVLKVTFPYSLREQMSEKMNFSYSDSDYGTYLNSQWSNNISKLLQGTIIDILSKSKLFKAVLADTSSLEESYRLESQIFTFEHKVRDKTSYADVSIQFTLIDANRGKLVKSKRFSYIEPTPSIDAKGYAIATNRVIHRLSQDLVAWIK